MSSQACWNHAIKNINATQNTLRQIIRITNAHQIAWFIFRQKRDGVIQCTILLGLCHTDGQPAHSTTGVARTNWIQVETVGGTI